MTQTNPEGTDSLFRKIVEIYPKFDPDSIQHSDELTGLKETVAILRNSMFWTADMAFYINSPQINMGIARRKNNLILNNLSEAAEILNTKKNYIITSEDLQKIIESEDTLLINHSDLRLENIGDQFHQNEYGTLIIDTKNYSALNKSERKLAERFCGQGEIFIKNMQSYANRGIKSIEIPILTEGYTRKNIPENKTSARACWTYEVANHTGISAVGRSMWLPNMGLMGELKPEYKKELEK